MSRTITLAALTILPVALLSITTLAQNAAPTTDSRPSFYQHMLQKMDTNGDGRISLDEYLAAASARFASIDTQKTGKIDATELANSPGATERAQHRADFLVKRLDKTGNGYVTEDEFVAAAQKRFARMDKRGDGKLTPDELTAPRWGHGSRNGAAQETAQSDDGARADKRAQFAQKYFDAIDTNHDGFITQDEYVAAASAKFKQLDTAGTNELTAAEIASSPKAQERVSHVADKMIKRMDTNGDGVVSQDEYMAAVKQRFAKMDKNGDGFIDADELPAHRWAHGSKPMPTGG
jgi:Ca2+-binding EF-hand superfamily protein